MMLLLMVMEKEANGGREARRKESESEK